MDSKRKTPTIRSSNKRPRVLAVDTSWCLRNKESLDVMSFAKEFGYTDQAKCHARYKAIIDNHIPSNDKLPFGKYYISIRMTNASNIGTSYINTIRNTNTNIIRTNFSYQ
ncbi:uncharacterized protein B0P05DRAFT_464224 [Gilbertella persicaria]|uniref:uncharacterized protein n=1 Tax=Gilbertella persicaria TaxID=101096 RepID=UPI00221F1B6B|nr:uncharacterized protein B0P05DRAFT_464224 [Gilbertella persicaria]KAI8090312.1 hypothetical protein B0P05DRAFT_464224 [Gilbertella persicaria]